MSTYCREDISITPYFDFELLLNLLQENRLGGKVLEDLAQTWETWLGKLHAVKLTQNSHQYIAVWLNEEVEHEIDLKWNTSPTESFRLNCLAQAMCMNAIYQIVPEVEESGCAPAPQPSNELGTALLGEGIPYKDINSAALARRYSVLTVFPFQGSCEICYLQEQCPKANTKQETFHSVVLPGYANLDKLN